MQVVDSMHQFAVAVVRIAVGVIFLWAGLEKAIGAGLGTWNADGFLQFGTGGSLGWPFMTGEVDPATVFNPTHDFWVGLVGTGASSFIAYLVPLGQIGIGLSLILGLFTRFGAAMGALMMLFFFVAAWDFQYGIVNQHLTYAFVTFLLGYLGSGNFYGLDASMGQNVSPGLRRWIFSGEKTHVAPVSTPAMA